MKSSQLKRTTLISALLLEMGFSAHAATINVDGNICNFNDAVDAANTDLVVGGCAAGSGADILELPQGVVLSLTNTAEITSEITINGNDSTLDGGGSFRVLRVIAPGRLSLNNSTVSYGYESDNFGGGIRVYDSDLKINNCTFTNNIGGAIIFTRSTGNIYDSVIDSNIGASGNYYGGGVSVASSDVVIANSTISNNSTQSANVGGGGIYVGNYFAVSELTISNTTLSGNSSTLRGGGLSAWDYGPGNIVTLTNTTIVNNSTSDVGGGIATDSTAITLSQSLISGNIGNGGPEVNTSGGTVTVDDYNLFGLNNNPGVAGVTVGGSDITPTEANLADIININLVGNGGLTPTHALNPTGPAVDAIPFGSCAILEDQTGKSRPIDGNVDGIADCDIGAFENPNPDIIFEDDFDG